MAIASEPLGNAPALTLSLSAEPCSTLGPNDGVTLSCQLTSISSPSCNTLVGTSLRFVLPPEAVVAPGEAAAIELPEIAPGNTRVVERIVRIHPSTLDGSVLGFEAVVYDGDGRLYRSNVILHNVRRRARLRGPRTFVRIERTDSARQVRIIAQVYNHGDAAAENITLSVPHPSGTRIAERTQTSRTFTHIAPDERNEFEYTASIDAAERTSLNVVDAVLSDASGNRVVLAPVSIELPAAFAAPQLTIERLGCRFHVRFSGINDGWGAARDVTLVFGWPQGFRCNRASLNWNAAGVLDFKQRQAVVRANVESDGVTFIAAAVDAGAGYEGGFDLYPPAEARDGCLDVALHTGSTVTSARTDVRWAPPAQIALRIASESDIAVVAGKSASVDLEIANSGNGDVDLTLAVAGAQAALRLAGALIENGGTVRVCAGERVDISAQLSLPSSAVAGRVEVTFSAGDATGDLARTTTMLRVRPAEPVKVPAWAGPDDLADGTTAADAVEAGLQPVTPALGDDTHPRFARQRDNVGFTLALTAARIERCLHVIRAATPTTVAGHICLLRVFLPDAVCNADAIVKERFRAVRDAHESALERLALRLRMPASDFNARHIDPTTHAHTIDLFERIAAGSMSGARADQDPQERQSAIATILIATYGCTQAERQLELLHATAEEGTLFHSTFALIPHTSADDVRIGSALASYVEALRAADSAASGAALERIDRERHGLVRALSERMPTSLGEPAGCAGDGSRVVRR